MAHHIERACRLLLAGGCLAAMLPAAGAWAQTAPAALPPAETNENDIIVTAQRRAERLEAVPVAITAVSGETLAKAGITRFQDLGNIAPGVQVSRGGAFTQPSIRGISTLTTGQGYENNVAVYVDGFFQSDTVAINGDLVNISDVQVLKGPQGTLYGRNATGGAILISTLAPSETFTGKAQVSYARFDDKRASAYLSGPLGDKIAFGVAGYYRKSDGYIRDIAGFDTAPVDQKSVRAKLAFKPTETLTATVGYNYSNLLDARGLAYTVHAYPFSIPAPPARATERNTSSLNRAPRNRVHVDDFTLKVALDTNIGTLTSYTGYTKKRTDLRFDFDASAVDISDTIQPSRQRTFQQSYDFAIDAIDWADIVIGMTYLHDNFSYTNQARSLGNYTRETHVRQKSDALAGYADVTFHLNDRLFLTTGARYSTETKNGSYFETPGNVAAVLSPSANKKATFSAFTPRGVLRYELAPRTNVYASVTQGFRTGTFPVSSFPNPALFQPIRPERITSYEVGFKTASSTFRFDAAAYYYDFKNIQVGLTVPNPLAPTTVVQQVINAEKARVYGAEASATYTPVRDLSLRAGANWTHARYTDFINATGTGLNIATQRNVTGQAQSWSGQQMARAPSVSGNIGANYKTPLAGGSLELSVNGTYTASFVISNPSLFGPLGPAGRANDQRYRQGAYGLVNAQIGWTDPSDRFTLTVFGENLTNTRYRVVASGGAFGDYDVYGEPITYGVRAGVKF